MKDFSQFILDLERLISHQSVFGAPEPNKPFGKEVDAALDEFIDISKRLGFSPVNHDGYIAEVTLGEGEEIGIIGHLDVVPVGIGWNTPPFTLTEKDGIYYGRGVCDDKAPLLLCLYALKELKDSGAPISRKFRLFAGTNEESGWQDVEYFSKRNRFPDYGFSPDGNFPVTYAEKGICEVEFCLDAPKNFTILSSGSALNAVCDYALLRVDGGKFDKNLLDKYSLKLKDGNLIESVGKAAHGSLPHLGKNAIKPLFELLVDCGENYKNALDCLFLDIHGVGKVVTDQGTLTLSPNLIRQEGDKVYVTCDCRIPYPETEESVCKIFDKFNIPYTTATRHPPMCAEKDGFLVNALINAYNSVTGESAEPIAMGGSTFARAFKYGCSFGPDLNRGGSGNLHDANEFMSKDDLLTCYKIYKEAIFNLAKK